MRPRLALLVRILCSWGALALVVAFYLWVGTFGGRLAREESAARVAMEQAMRLRQQAKAAESALESFATTELRERIVAVQGRLLGQDPEARAQEETRIKRILEAHGWSLRLIKWAPSPEGAVLSASLQAAAPPDRGVSDKDGRLGDWLRAASLLWEEGPPLEWTSYSIGREPRGEFVLQADLIYPVDISL
jgi:hypothetical protein